MKETICRIISGLLVAVIAALAAMAVPAMAADDFVDVPANAWYFDTVEICGCTRSGKRYPKRHSLQTTIFPEPICLLFFTVLLVQTK